MKSKQALVFTLLIFIAIFPLHSQADFRSGFIITLDQDTIKGDIDYKTNSSLGTVCRFKETQTSDVKRYSPEDIASFKFDDGKYYVSKVLSGNAFFLEFLIKGKVNIYYLRDENGDRYFLEKEDINLLEIPYEESIKKQDGKSYIHTSKKHIGILNYYLQDAPKLKARIDRFKKPTHDNLITLAKDYHNTVCDDYACIVFEDKVPKVTFSPELRLGVFHLNNTEFIVGNNFFQYGAILHIGMPRKYNRLYVETGALLTKLTLENDEGLYLKIPFHLEYRYPKGLIRPKLSYGINFYYPEGYTVGMNGGVHIALTDRLQVALTAEAEFYQVGAFLPRFKELQYTSFYGGLVLSL